MTPEQTANAMQNMVIIFVLRKEWYIWSSEQID